ncbi:hypothetical protein L1887_02770 [Cichorium endivia]|nr:hypothetical protein L1887_02770 [Cichorium endivia]
MPFADAPKDSGEDCFLTLNSSLSFYRLKKRTSKSDNVRLGLKDAGLRFSVTKLLQELVKYVYKTAGKHAMTVKQNPEPKKKEDKNGHVDVKGWVEWLIAIELELLHLFFWPRVTPVIGYHCKFHESIEVLEKMSFQFSGKNCGTDPRVEVLQSSIAINLSEIVEGVDSYNPEHQPMQALLRG